MTDPFQNVDAAGDDFIAAFADSMDARQADPTMEQIVAAYLQKLEFTENTLTVEVGSGAGAVTRRIAAAASPGVVIGFEPSIGFVKEATKRVTNQPNVSFQVANGTALPLQDGSADHVILHTVLTHVENPASLIAEARRVLKSGGRLVICDADFSKATLGSFPNDPLDACARAFVQDFVTDPFIVAQLRPMLADAGFDLVAFDIQSRTILDNEQMMPWVEQTAKAMVARGDIGQTLCDGLIAEYRRRAEAKRLYGYQVFATAIGCKPGA